MFKTIVIAGLLGLLPVAQAATPSPAIQVREAWTRATPPHAPTAVGYLTLVNTAAQADRLVRARSPAAARVELHESAMQGGVMRMRQVDGVDLPAGATVSLAPSGTHLMLVAPTGPLVAGQQVEVTLSFAHAPDLVVHLKVMPLGAAGPHDMHDMHM